VFTPRTPLPTHSPRLIRSAAVPTALDAGDHSGPNPKEARRTQVSLTRIRISQTPAVAGSAPIYAENTRWRYGDVVFTGLNVPGSNNNKVTAADCPTNSARTDADCAADNVEYAARDVANVDFLRETFAEIRMHAAAGGERQRGGWI
jgi:hypothetical protein